jgi:hypothetical protein
MNQTILNKKVFSKTIEEKVKHNRMSYTDSIINTCEDFNVEPEDCKKYIKPEIVEKLLAEGIELNLVESDSNTLTFSD